MATKSKVKVSIEGLDQLQRALKETPKLARVEMRTAVANTSQALLATARQLAPHKLNDLRDHLMVMQGPRALTARIGIEDIYLDHRQQGKNKAHTNPAVYGWFQEFGYTRGGKSYQHKFLRVAAELHRATFINEMVASGARLESAASRAA